MGSCSLKIPKIYADWGACGAAGSSESWVDQPTVAWFFGFVEDIPNFVALQTKKKHSRRASPYVSYEG